MQLGFIMRSVEELHHRCVGVITVLLPPMRYLLLQPETLSRL